MGKIHLLDEATVNKIAAGEVIERPASAVKELIENSIDAGATDIRIEVVKGGKKLIRVSDNGSGMSKEDASISFLKHATSKISDIEDIEKVATMGFRGEALSSITAVAKVEIITKTKDELAGTKITVHGGKLIKIEETGSSDGTTVAATDLFYNTPARKKYLKSDPTELAHITDIVTKNAIGHNSVSFSLNHNGKEIFRSPASGELLDTIIHIYGQEVARVMVPVYQGSELVSISGLISKPSITRGSLDFLSFYINDRSITSRSISNALRKGYGTIIPKGRFPVAVLKLSINRNLVDVNVHPTKNQVRISHEKEISDTVTQAVSTALSAGDLIPAVKIPTTQSRFYENTPENMIIRETVPGIRETVKDSERRILQTRRSMDEKQTEKEVRDFRVLGQVENLYIFVETDEGIIIVDQHAAHERVLFEQVRDSKHDDSQELIVPVNLELDSKERVLIQEYIPFLEKFGFRISEFGPDTFAITAVPDTLGKMEDAELIHDVISDILSEGRIKESTGIFEKVTKSIACRGAIKAGAECTTDQMGEVVRQLLSCENPYTCPHGRPTMVSFNRQELDKLFKRS